MMQTTSLRAVIYARYSSEQQREASIEDQLEVCRRLAAREGWHVVATYEDRAMSGASRFRSGYLDMIRDAEAGSFDLVLCESLDRLGRKLSETADLFDRLRFQNVALHTCSEGRISEVHVGVMGMMAQKFLSDLRDKTWRGQLGVARAGRIPGGLAYGYAVVPAQRDGQDAGRRVIVPHEAAVVRRIFGAYAAGASPRRIAHDLNAEGVPGPGGRKWGDTTIRGQVDRGTGILNNALYVGRLEWNRCSYVKDPRTGRRVARVNPADRREMVELPDLRIIDQVLWDRTRERQDAMRLEMARDAAGNALNRAHRQKF